MSETPQAGTPEPEPVVSESAGSAAGATDDSETLEQLQKKLADERALRLAQQENVEKANREREELNRLRQQQAAAQQGQDPRVAFAASLQERAPYDPDAAAQLQLLIGQVRQEAENRLQEEMFLNAVPREAWAQVKGLVQQSNYSMSVADALRSVVPPKDTALEKKLAEMQAEIERLKAPKKVLGASAGAASTMPAAAVSTPEDTMPFSQYKALLAAGGSAGQDAKRRKDAGTLSLDYNS